MVVPAGQGAMYRIFFDILLDIRELLLQQSEREMIKQVKEEREEQRDIRENKIKEQIEELDKKVSSLGKQFVL